MLELDARRARSTEVGRSPGCRRLTESPVATSSSRSAAPDHRTVDAQTAVTLARSDDAPVAGAETAGHRLLHRELDRHRSLRAECSHRLQHRAAARTHIRLVRRRSTEFPLEQLGDEPVVAGRPVIGRNRKRIAEQLGGAAVLPRAESRAGCAPRSLRPRAPPARSRAARSRFRLRRAAPWRPPASTASGAEKPIPSGPASQRSSPGVELRQPAGARPDFVDQEVEPPATHPADREGAGQVRPLGRPLPPPSGSGKHVELARQRSGTVGVLGAD